MAFQSILVSWVILFALASAVSAQFPFFGGAGKIFGYEYFGGRSTETECSTEKKHPGTCMSRRDCTQHGGVASGSCGDNTVCCEIAMKCGKVSRSKKTVIRNPTPIPEHCMYYFRPYNKYVCQLRIDINTKLGTPTVPAQNQAGSFVQCDKSFLKVGDKVICGVNRNQHVYLPFLAEGNIDAEILISAVHGDTEFAATDFWDIVVTQIECQPKIEEGDTHKEQFWDFAAASKHRQFDNNLIAPEGCLQYFTERTGVIESFNFNNGRGPYLGNTKYAICFKKTSHDHTILFEASHFDLATNLASDSTDRNCYVSGSTTTSGDYLLIPESRLVTPDGITPVVTAEATKYCGTIMKDRQVFYQPLGPFVIGSFSDNRFSGTETGWSITYTIQ